MSEEKDILVSFTTRQVSTIMDILVNLHWCFLRDALADWDDNDYRKREITPDIIHMIEKFCLDLQELESIIKGVQIK